MSMPQEIWKESRELSSGNGYETSLLLLPSQVDSHVRVKQKFIIKDEQGTLEGREQNVNLTLDELSAITKAVIGRRIGAVSGQEMVFNGTKDQLYAYLGTFMDEIRDIVSDQSGQTATDWLMAMMNVDSLEHTELNGVQLNLVRSLFAAVYMELVDRNAPV